MASAHNAQASRVLVNHGAPVRLQYPHPVAGCLALRTLVHAIAAFRVGSASLVVLILTWSCLCKVNSIINPILKAVQRNLDRFTFQAEAWRQAYRQHLRTGRLERHMRVLRFQRIRVASFWVVGGGCRSSRTSTTPVMA